MNTEISKNMDLYIGTKVVKASTEMSRREYYSYRGWKLSEDENGDDRVYLVEYEKDPSFPINHPNHEGYISMSSKEVFEKSYKKAKHLGNINYKQFTEPYQVRVIDEALELTTKLDKLYEFITENKFFKTLDIVDQTLLIKQKESMMYYLTVLVERIERFK